MGHDDDQRWGCHRQEALRTRRPVRGERDGGRPGGIPGKREEHRDGHRPGVVHQPRPWSAQGSRSQERKASSPTAQITSAATCGQYPRPPERSTASSTPGGRCQVDRRQRGEAEGTPTQPRDPAGRRRRRGCPDTKEHERGQHRGEVRQHRPPQRERGQGHGPVILPSAAFLHPPDVIADGLTEGPICGRPAAEPRVHRHPVDSQHNVSREQQGVAISAANRRRRIPSRHRP